MSKYAALDTSADTLLYVGSTQGRWSSKSAIAAPSLCRCQFFALIPSQVIPICGPVISKMPVLVAGCLLAYKGCGTVVGGNCFQEKVPLQKKRAVPIDTQLLILTFPLFSPLWHSIFFKMCRSNCFTKVSNPLKKTDWPYSSWENGSQSSLHRFVFC